MAGVARTTLGRYLNQEQVQKRLLQSQSAFNLTESRKKGTKRMLQFTALVVHTMEFRE